MLMSGLCAMSSGVDCSNLIRTRNSSLAHSAPTLSTSLVSYNITRSLLLATCTSVVDKQRINDVCEQMVRATENDAS